MEFKKCSGYHGKCYHSADMIVPAHMFSMDKQNSDGLRHICKTCDVEAHSGSNPLRPILYKMAGSRIKFYSLPREDRKALRAEARLEVTGNVIPMPKPKFDDMSPRSNRLHSTKMPTGATREGPGFVYIYQDIRIPEDLKVGSEKVSHGRLSGAGTWGFYRCVFNAPFERRYEAERDVHKILASKRIVSNKEIFKCEVIEAQVAIETVSIRHKLNEGKTSTTGA